MEPTTNGIRLAEATGTVEHQDLGAIAPTELDGITINRTKTKVDPFVEIRKERLVDKLSGAPSRSFGIWVPDPNKEGGWRDMGTVSENYLLLTNAEVRDVALEIASESGHPFRETRVFWDGARFAHIIDFTAITEEVEAGDAVGLSLITRTSYDRSWRYEAALMGKRFLCDNGALSGEFFARVSFKHVVSAEPSTTPWEEIVKQGLGIIGQAGGNLYLFVEALRKLRMAPMTDTHLRALWQALPGLGNSIKGKIISRYVKNEEPTLYGLFNAGTNVLWNNKKLTAADFGNNDTFSTTFINYAFDNLN